MIWRKPRIRGVALDTFEEPAPQSSEETTCKYSSTKSALTKTTTPSFRVPAAGNAYTNEISEGGKIRVKVARKPVGVSADGYSL